MKTGFFAVIFSLLLSITWVGCEKDQLNSRMLVRMTDAPGLYDKVNIDISSVEIHYSDNSMGNAGWISLATNAGIYDLIRLQNGVNVVLADEFNLPAGHITQMRLILGTENTIIVSGVEHALFVPSGLNTGIKINLHTDLYANSGKEILLDFDAEKSIVVEGNGDYSLAPVISVKEEKPVER